MNRSVLFKLFNALLAASIIALAFPANADAQSTPAPSPQPASSRKTWQFGVTPYIWVPNLNGSLTFLHPGRPVVGVPPSTVDLNVHVGPSSYLSNLNSAVMFTAEAHRSDWSILTDLMYLNLSSSKVNILNVTGPLAQVEIPINVAAQTRMTGTVWTLSGAYRLPEYSQTAGTFLDVLAGFRYANVNASLSWQFAGPLDILDRTGTAARSVTLWDPIVGIRGKIGLSDRWFIPYYGDIGWGSDNTTTQGLLGIGYSSRCCDYILANRWLNYYMTNGLLNNAQLVGPALGVRFRF